MFTQDGAFVLHLKMAPILLKVPDDHVRMCMQGFSFWQKQDIFQNLEKYNIFLRGAR